MGQKPNLPNQAAPGMAPGQKAPQGITGLPPQYKILKIKLISDIFFMSFFFMVKKSFTQESKTEKKQSGPQYNPSPCIAHQEK
jgi:hypothetical protein